MRRISVDLDEDTFKRLSMKCVEMGKKKTEIIRELIDKWLQEES